MQKSRFAYRLIAVLLSTTLLFQPLCEVSILIGGRARVAQAAPSPQQLDQGETTLYLPLIASPPTTASADPPQFVINNPVNGSSVGGITYFSIQPTDADAIASVSFHAGDVDLGVDTDGSDGFRVFMDASELSAGQMQLTAEATGAGGTHTETINVTIVPNPPQTATIGQEGGVLASEIGSVISLLPGSVPDGTTVTVDELTQEETTERHGIEWEDMGVTFLGAQDVQSSVPIDGPLGMVVSAGFGNRVQPGQAVVNYRLAPDADGDGRSEIVVINTASVAPNGDVIADPVLQPSINSVQIQSQSGQSSMRFITGGKQSEQPLKGAVGNILDFQVVGFNPQSAQGNVAVWTSLVDGQEFEMASLVLPTDINQDTHKFMAIIPPLPVGDAQVVLVNQSSGFEAEPISVEIQAAESEISVSAISILNQYWADMISFMENQEISSQEEIVARDRVLTNIAKIRDELQQLVSSGLSPEQEQALVGIALMVQNSPVYHTQVGLSRGPAISTEFGPDTIIDITLGVLGGVALLLGLIGLTTAGTALGAAAAIYLIIHGLCKLATENECFPSLLKCLIGQNGPNGTTGMGAAPPPGGPGCGNAGGGENNVRTNNKYSQLGGPYAIKIFSNGNPTPFTGLTDPGGYFFVPFIPAGEPFTAISIDTVTGDTREFSGVGPATGESTFMFFDFFTEQAFTPSIQWDGGGDGTSWDDPLNWDTDVVPAESDRVLIDVSGTPTITFSAGGVTIVSLQSAENMQFTGGSLTVQAQSLISGVLAVDGNVTFVADGQGASLTTTGPGTAAGLRLTARGGGKIIMPGLTTYEGNGGGFFSNIKVDGAGSLIDLSAVTSFSGNTFVNDHAKVDVRNGGQFDLSSVTAIDVGKTQFIADGDGSRIDLSSLTHFARGGGGTSSLVATNGGVIIANQLAELRGININLDNTGTLATSQMDTVTGSHFQLTGATPDLGQLRDVDGTSFTLQAGAQVLLPQITSYAGDGEGSGFFTKFTIEGAGSLLDLSTLTTLAGNTFVNDSLQIKVTDGGKVDLSNISQIDVGKVQFTASGDDSLIDLSSLTRFVRDTTGQSILSPTAGGTILIDQLTDAQGISLILDSTGTLATSQIRSFIAGGIDISGFTPDFNQITDIDGSDITVRDGGTVAFPLVDSFAGDSEGSGFFTDLRAEGAGSVLDLSNVTTMVGNTFVNDHLGIEAAEGGRINLSALTEITGGNVKVTSGGANSLIDMSSLTSFIRTSQGSSFLYALDNGAIQLNNGQLTLNAVNVALQEQGTMTVGALTLTEGGRLYGDGILDTDVHNQAILSPGESSGDASGHITIGGSYVQADNGTLVVKIGGATDFDQVTVNGAMTLNGTLDIGLNNDFVPSVGDTFVILTANAVTGAFGELIGNERVTGIQFEVSYSSTAVTVNVVAVNVVAVNVVAAQTNFSASSR
ncbi:MAG: Ig-like domain-containing protein [Chloroflexota bacterium]